MGVNALTMYDVDPHVAEIYDQHETCTDDVELLRTLISGRWPLHVLEPFCGTGRILIPLAQDGHDVVGMDQARGMVTRAQTKIHQLPTHIQRYIRLDWSECT